MPDKEGDLWKAIGRETISSTESNNWIICAMTHDRYHRSNPKLTEKGIYEYGVYGVCVDRRCRGRNSMIG